MKSFALLSLLVVAPLVSLAVAESLPEKIADPIGRAGMVAAVLPANADRPQPALIWGGGANFPYAKDGATTPEERGEKAYYTDVECFLLGKGELVPAGFPRPVAYAAFVPTDKGLLVAGGCNASGHTSKVSRMDVVDDELRVEALPDLPRTVAYSAFAIVGRRVYVMGGQESADSPCCLNSCFMLNLDDVNAGWKEVAPMPGGRMLAAAGVVNGVVYVMGGCSLEPDEQGNARRTYLKDVLCYDPGSNTWAKVPTEMPETLVGMANPLPVAQDKLYVVGGDPGHFYRASLEGNAPAEHPGQSRTVYSYTPASGDWARVGELPLGVATMPAVVVEGAIYTISGETRPGVRTPLIMKTPAQ